MLYMKKKKSLGQHFLHTPSYLKKIVDAADIRTGEMVLEVGPGDGALTALLLERGARVIAVEKDRRLIEILNDRFAGKNVEIIEDDILHFDISRHVEDREYKIVANIPYYITGALLKKFLSTQKQPSSMTLLLQKEVAWRIARSKKESILSLSVKAYGEPAYIVRVPAGAFSPAPRVDSAVLHIANISREHFTNPSQETRFFELVRAGFSQKRKLLKSNLKPVLGEKVLTILERAEIGENARAEDVPLSKWFRLV
jgi:16S rRNA (adenine1518-N6/adenine1519-N6)-dimethyltransferase